MEILNVCLWLLGAEVVLFGISWLCLLLERKIPIRKFDERQQDARAKAYRFGFWVGMLYFLALWFLLLFPTTKELLLEHIANAVAGGIFLQVLAGHFYMFLTGSDMPFSQKPTLIFVVYYALGLMWIFSAYNRYREQAWLGTYTIPWLDLMLATVWLTLGVLHFINWLKGYCDE